MNTCQLYLIKLMYIKTLPQKQIFELFPRAPKASAQHLVNLQFRPEGLGVKIAERSDCNFHDNRNCQVEPVVLCLFLNLLANYYFSIKDILVNINFSIPKTF